MFCRKKDKFSRKGTQQGFLYKHEKSCYHKERTENKFGEERNLCKKDIRSNLSIRVLADELGLEPGDRLLSIDGHELEDIFDYEYYIENESIMVVIAKKNGEEWELDIENDYQDLGPDL